MTLHLTEKELRVIKWALIQWSIKIESKMKTVQEKDIWVLYEEELNITEEMIIKINNYETEENLPKSL